MERVAENGKGNIPLTKQRENIPEPAVQDRIAPCDIEIGLTFHAAAHLHAVVQHSFCTVERHLHQFGVSLGEDVAMLAALVATVGDMPLKSEVFHILLSYSIDYFAKSPADD